MCACVAIGSENVVIELNTLCCCVTKVKRNQLNSQEQKSFERNVQIEMLLGIVCLCMCVCLDFAWILPGIPPIVIVVVAYCVYARSIS